jgi:hypothetical protein
MPYDTYRLHQIERAKTPAEVRRADEQAARVASAVSSLCVASPGQRELCAGHSRPRPAYLARPDELACAVKAPKGDKHNVCLA